jgi:hypothetical protein|tara:strand:- start:1067 stop:1384 length:318 start_codon:yes stop_codon:yes gene_type:complete
MLEELDIGHKSLNVLDALSSLETAISNAKNNNLVAIKVVHGSGSGTIRKAVRTWGQEQEGRFKGIIWGEDYNMFNKDAVMMRSELVEKKDKDFNRKNSGITIFWL